MPKYLSGRSKKTSQSALKDDRYRYLSVEDAEPNLGDPVSPGESPPFGQQYQSVSIEGYPGERYWIPIGGGLIPGSISIFDENGLIGGLSSTTQLNFVGLAVTAQGSGGPNPGIAVTIRIFAPGNNQELLFNSSNEFGTSTKLTFDSSSGLLTAGDQIIVGAGGTVITTTSGGLVGIGTPNPTEKLDVNGDIRIRGTIYDSLNQPGTQSQIIVKNNSGGLLWVNQGTIRSGAGGTYRDIQFHNSAGLVDGASNFVYDDVNSRVGIGSTLPQRLLDVKGSSRFIGPTEIDFLNVTGVTTTTTLAVTGTSTTRNLIVTGVTTLGTLNGTSANFTGIVTALKFNGAIDVTNLYVTGISTFKQKVNIDSNLGVIGLTTTQNLQVYSSTTLNSLTVSGTSTFNSQVNINNLNVTGVGTFDNIKIYDNNIETLTGNLILNSNSGTVEVIDKIFVNDTTEDTTGNRGSIFTTGGVGIEKNLNVGGAVKLATSGGITTTGGDLYVGGDLYIQDDIFYDEINGRRAEFSEFLKTKDFQVTGIATIATLGVAGLTTTNTLIVYSTTQSTTKDIGALIVEGGVGIEKNLNVGGDLSVSGITTLGDATSDTVTFTARVNSSVLPSTNGTLDLGGTSNKWNNVYANTFVGNVTGNADTATKLATARNIAITGDLAWNVNFDGSANVTSTGTLANTGVVAATYGSSTTIPVFAVDSKGRVTSVTNTGVNFSAATVAQSDTIKTVATATNASFYPTFVDSNNSVAAYEALYTDGGISYNPSTDLLTLTNLSVSGTILDSTNSSGTAGAVLKSTGTGVFWDLSPETSSLYKGAVVRGYTIGGYQNSVAYNTAYKTIHSTDTTTNLGAIMSFYDAYTAAASSGTFAYSFYGFTTTGYGDAGNKINKLNMITDANVNLATTMTTSKSYTSVMRYKFIRAYVFGNSTNPEKFVYSTETPSVASTSWANSSDGSTSQNTAYGDDIGYFAHSGTGKYLIFATESWNTWSLTGGIGDGPWKNISTFNGYIYWKNSATNFAKFNSANASSVTQQNITTPSQQEENYHTGENKGYMVGMYVGVWSSTGGVLDYVSDTFTNISSVNAPAINSSAAGVEFGRYPI